MRQVTLRSVSDARQRGIETVYQDLALINDLPVYLNMALKRESTWGWLPLLDRRRMRREARERLSEIAIRLPSIDTEVTFLSGGQRQAIAVARAVFSDAKVIFLDEPLAAMGVKESMVILDLIRELKRRGGTSIIMIAHNFAQIIDVCDRVIALQRGAITYDRPVGSQSLTELTELIASDYRAAESRPRRRRVRMSSALRGAGCTAESSTSSGDGSWVAGGAPGRHCRTRTSSQPGLVSAAPWCARRSRCCRPRDSSRCGRRPGHASAPGGPGISSTPMLSDGCTPISNAATMSATFASCTRCA